MITYLIIIISVGIITGGVLQIMTVIYISDSAVCVFDVLVTQIILRGTISLWSTDILSMLNLIWNIIIYGDSVHKINATILTVLCVWLRQKQQQQEKVVCKVNLTVTRIPSHACTQLQQSMAHKHQLHSRLTSYPMGQ